MNALHLENGTVTLINAPKPKAKAGHVLVRLRLAGICNTDLELQRGYYGFAGRPGHEFVGERVDTGQRVTGEINLACGRCDWCARGLGRHCSRRSVLGIVKHPGAFAEYLTLPEVNLHPVPGHDPDEHAVFTEPVAAACEILDQITIPPGEPVAVLGDGKLGLLIAQVLAAHGARVHLHGKHANKLKIARKAGVKTHFVDEKTRSRYNITVDATGSPAGLRAAAALTRPRGTIVMKSTIQGETSLDFAPLIVNEITLVGSRCGRFEPALELISQGRLQLDDMIDSEFPLSEGPAAFARAAQPGVLKVLLRP
ncbi:MAG TPA: alcohol dehydrogenase catalytic domain-containing protein [Bryobacteraceae bacterium]|nr:alcohol dehydrogenase [Bryobacterales bacterium]HRJ19673.1 alcohol dehydrogenase catalytic domain-containing protein [Bryobacteraceae bacterium]